MSVDLEAAEKVAKDLFYDFGQAHTAETIRVLVAEVKRVRALVVEQGDLALAAMDERDEARRQLAEHIANRKAWEESVRKDNRKYEEQLAIAREALEHFSENPMPMTRELARMTLAKIEGSKP